MGCETDLKEAFHAALGRFIVAWTSLEFILDALALLVRLRSQPEPPKVPYPLRQKLNFIRRQQAQLVPPFSRTSELLARLEEVAKLASLRDDIVHGAMLSHVTASKLIVTVGVLLQPPKQPRRPMRTITIVEIDSASGRVDEITDSLHDVFQALGASKHSYN